MTVCESSKIFYKSIHKKNYNSCSKIQNKNPNNKKGKRSLNFQRGFCLKLPVFGHGMSYISQVFGYRHSHACTSMKNNFGNTRGG